MQRHALIDGFRDVGIGLTTTLILVVVSAFVHFLESQYHTDTQSGDWHLLPFTVLVLVASTIVIARPALSLWDLWSMHLNTAEALQNISKPENQTSAD